MLPKNFFDSYSLKFGFENLYPALPEIFIFFSSLLLLFLNLTIFKKDKKNKSYRLSIIIILSALFITIFQTNFGLDFNKLYYSSETSRYFKVVVLLSALFVLIISHNQVNNIELSSIRFYFLLLISTCGTLILLSSYNFLTLYLALQLQMIPIYIIGLLKYHKDNFSKNILNYFVIGALSSSFMLFGISLIYGFTGTVSFDVFLNKDIIINSGFFLGAIIFIFGLFLKMALIPFHNWLPNVFELLPLPISFFIITAQRISIFGILILVIYKIFPYFNDNLTIIITIGSIFSMFFGSIACCFQDKINRLIAFMSISNTGFILIGIVCNSKTGLSSTLYCILINLFLMLGIFTTMMILKKDNRSIEYISDLKGLYNDQPFISLCFLILMLSFIGFPPFSGFFGKWFLFYASVESNLYFLTFIGVISSLISSYYCLNILRFIFFENSDIPLNVEQNFGIKFLMYFSSLISLLFFMILPFLEDFINNLNI